MTSRANHQAARGQGARQLIAIISDNEVGKPAIAGWQASSQSDTQTAAGIGEPQS